MRPTRIMFWIGVIGLVTLSGRAPPVLATGPYPVPAVASITFTIPPTVLTPDTWNFLCLARADYTGGSSVPARMVCYNAAKPGPAPPPPPPPYQQLVHRQLTATVNQTNGTLTASILNCLYVQWAAPPTGLQITMTAFLSKTGGPASGMVTVLQDTTAPIDCAAGTTATGPLTLTPLVQSKDTDRDGCADWEELGTSELSGGLRDPFNFWDFYDVWTHPSGDPSAWVRDQRVTYLGGDIIGVLSRFGTARPGGAPTEAQALAEALTPPTSDTGYHTDFDRGPVIGPNGWNLGPPDGKITFLGGDVIEVLAQFNHNCAGAP